MQIKPTPPTVDELALEVLRRILPGDVSAILASDKIPKYYAAFAYRVARAMEAERTALEPEALAPFVLGVSTMGGPDVLTTPKEK
jgi:hypothetical protein